MDNQIYRNIFAGLFAGILFIAGFGFVYQWVGADYASKGMTVFPQMTKSSGFKLKEITNMSTGLTDIQLQTSKIILSVNKSNSSPISTNGNMSLRYNNVRSGMQSMTSRSKYMEIQTVPGVIENIRPEVSVLNSSVQFEKVAFRIVNSYEINSAKGKNITSNGFLAMGAPSFTGSDLTASSTMQKILPGTGGDATFEELAPVSEGVWILLAVVLLYFVFRYSARNQNFKIFHKNKG